MEFTRFKITGVRINLILGFGLLGRSLAYFLHRSGRKVIVVSRSGRPDGLPHEIKWITGDIHNNFDLERLIMQAAHVYYFVSSGSPRDSEIADQFSRVYLSTLRLVCEACIKYEVAKLVFPSSVSVYGNYDYPVSELTPVAPLSQYARTKIKSEQLLKEYSKNGLKYISLRISNPYGFRQYLSGSGFIGIVMRNIIKNKSITLFQNGLAARDFIYIDDLMRVTLQLVDLDSSPPVVNIGSGISTTLIDLVYIAESCLGKKASIIMSKSDSSEINKSLINNSLLLNSISDIDFLSPQEGICRIYHRFIGSKAYSIDC